VELLAELRRVAQIRVVRPPDWRGGPEWPFGDDLDLANEDCEPETGETNLVHLGNNPYHEWLLHRISMPNTVVVLHDLVLHHLLVEATVQRGNDKGYRERLEAAYGTRALPLVFARMVGVTGRRDPFLFPALSAFLTGCSGVIVHSEWALEQTMRDLPGIPARRVGLAVADPGLVDRVAVRQRLGVSSESVLLMHLGFLTPEKGLLDILSGLAAARRIGVPVHLVLVGEGGERSTIDRAVASLGLERCVSFAGWIPPDRFRELPAGADLGVVLRAPSAGETSASVVRFLACGTPVAVTGLNQFLEWSELSAPRITPGPSAAACLTGVLQEAGLGGTGWEKRRVAAREAYEDNHQPLEVARQLVDALEEILGS